ncbi:hypothetical protein [Rhodonellum sp.]|uniref:hypothetical protein n=1 Tax=Rhodonellum sp. TaxID=2231180 RepID=UPI0027259094|nr:hypothetical protein [Rhodonellum sp.]MDO9551228.1 hypothetical protein [Rhodonellum sp.]
MKSQTAKHPIFLLIAYLLMGCASDEESTPKIQLSEVGFVGSLPDGRNFGSKGIKTSNSTGLSAELYSSRAAAYVYHGLTIRDAISGIDIYLQLPKTKFKEDFGIQDLDQKGIANEFYPYDKVKEILAIGNKNIPFEEGDSWEDNFYIAVLDQRNYNGYTLLPGLLDAGNFLKIIHLIEGTEENAAGENIRTIEVIFDMDVKLRSNDAGLEQQGNLKGQLRMKYRENFDQSEFESN